MTANIDAAASAWLSAVSLLADLVPNASNRRNSATEAAIRTGVPTPLLNAVISIDREPDAEALAMLARTTSWETMPWSIQVRPSSPSARVAKVAQDQGLNNTSFLPFMLASRNAIVRDRAVGTESVNLFRVGSERESSHAGLLERGYETPPGMMRAMGGAAVLDQPRFHHYHLEVDGVPAATALAVVADGHVGVFNVAVLPEFRRRGFGRAATLAALDAGFSAGAEIAYLHASPAGLPLYEELGFSVVEEWTAFTGS